MKKFLIAIIGLAAISSAALAESGYGYLACAATKDEETLIVVFHAPTIFEYESENASYSDDPEERVQEIYGDLLAFGAQISERWGEDFNDAVKEQVGLPCDAETIKAFGPDDSPDEAMRYHSMNVLVVAADDWGKEIEEREITFVPGQ